jgi:hypothetical protein
MRDKIEQVDNGEFRVGHKYFGIDPNLDPNNMPDSFEKYQTIIYRRFEKDIHEKFTDT